jgi:hypothetical protein
VPAPPGGCRFSAGLWPGPDWDSPDSPYLRPMEIRGQWTKDEEGFMEFDPPSLQRYYEAVTDRYHQVYNHYLEQLDDDEDAYFKALADGYEMVTDYQDLDGHNQFVTTYKTPSYVLDIWYEVDPVTEKKMYDRGFIRVIAKDPETDR